MATLANLIIDLRVNDRTVRPAFRDAISRTEALGEAVGKVGRAMAVFPTAPLGIIAGFAIKSAVEFENLNRGMTAVMGSARAASDEFARLREVAKLPGLGFTEAIQGSLNLQAAGFSANLARRSLMGFGNALATIGRGREELFGIVRAMSQIASKGLISAEEINQLAERLPNIRMIMQDAFGTGDPVQLQKRGVTIEAFFTGIADQLAKQPKMTKGVQVAWEDFQDTLKVTAASFAQETLPTITKGLKAITGLMEDVKAVWSGMSTTDKQITGGLLAIAVAIGPVLIGLSMIVKMWAGLIALAKTSPIGKGLQKYHADIAAAQDATQKQIAEQEKLFAHEQKLTEKRIAMEQKAANRELAMAVRNQERRIEAAEAGASRLDETRERAVAQAQKAERAHNMTLARADEARFNARAQAQARLNRLQAALNAKKITGPEFDTRNQEIQNQLRNRMTVINDRVAASEANLNDRIAQTGRTQKRVAAETAKLQAAVNAAGNRVDLANERIEAADEAAARTIVIDKDLARTRVDIARIADEEAFRNHTVALDRRLQAEKDFNAAYAKQQGAAQAVARAGPGKGAAGQQARQQLLAYEAQATAETVAARQRLVAAENDVASAHAKAGVAAKALARDEAILANSTRAASAAQITMAGTTRAVGVAMSRTAVIAKGFWAMLWPAILFSAVIWGLGALIEKVTRLKRVLNDTRDEVKDFQGKLVGITDKDLQYNLVVQSDRAIAAQREYMAVVAERKAVEAAMSTAAGRDAADLHNKRRTLIAKEQVAWQEAAERRGKYEAVRAEVKGRAEPSDLDTNKFNNRSDEAKAESNRKLAASLEYLNDRIREHRALLELGVQSMDDLQDHQKTAVQEALRTAEAYDKVEDAILKVQAAGKPLPAGTAAMAAELLKAEQAARATATAMLAIKEPIDAMVSKNAEMRKLGFIDTGDMHDGLRDAFNEAQQLREELARSTFEMEKLRAGPATKWEPARIGWEQEIERLRALMNEAEFNVRIQASIGLERYAHQADVFIESIDRMQQAADATQNALTELRDANLAVINGMRIAASQWVESGAALGVGIKTLLSGGGFRFDMGTIFQPLKAAGASLAGAFLGIAAALGPMAIVTNLISGMMETLGPALEAVMVPIKMVGEALGRGLIPIIKALFPVMKLLAIAMTYVAQFLLNAIATVVNGIGWFVRAIGKLIDKIPGVSGGPLVRAGDAMMKTADELYAAAGDMSNARDEIKALTWADAMDRVANAANKAADSFGNLPDILKVERLIGDARRVDAQVSGGGVPATATTASTGAASQVNINLGPNSVQIVSTGNETPRQLWRKVHEGMLEEARVTGGSALDTALSFSR